MDIYKRHIMLIFNRSGWDKYYRNILYRRADK
jgi:hypothetical protein